MVSHWSLGWTSSSFTEVTNSSCSTAMAMLSKENIYMEVRSWTDRATEPSKQPGGCAVYRPQIPHTHIYIYIYMYMYMYMYTYVYIYICIYIYINTWALLWLLIHLLIGIFPRKEPYFTIIKNCCGLSEAMLHPQNKQTFTRRRMIIILLSSFGVVIHGNESWLLSWTTKLTMVIPIKWPQIAIVHN